MLDPDMMVLEVKFTELLPSVIQELLPLDGQQFSAISKYTLCYEAAFFRTDIRLGFLAVIELQQTFFRTFRMFIQKRNKVPFALQLMGKESEAAGQADAVGSSFK